MKKTRLIFLFAPLVFTSLTGCRSSSSKPVHLTFGIDYVQTEEDLIVLDCDALLDKANSGETFILATYQGQYSNTCECWTTFKNIILTYTNWHHERIYLFDTQEQDDSIKHLKIQKFNDSTPCLYIFDGNTRLAKFSEKNSKDEKVFTDTTGETMYSRIHKYVKPPILEYVDQNFLNNNLNNHDKAILLFVREGCGDCKYVIPHVLIPYTKTHSLNGRLWIYDLQKLYDLSNDETASEEEKGQYQATKDLYGLSINGNETYGYGNGVVPTIQYYENGILQDASVFFNDKVEQKEDGSFVINDSYYSEERLPNLHYLEGVNFTTILKGKTLNAWSKDEAAKYHTPIFEAFLNRYLAIFQ